MIRKATAAMAAILLASTSLAACAHNPDEVEADYVPPLTYASMSCDELQQELIRISDEVHKVTGQQREKARNDKLAVGAAIIFWPTLFALASGDKENKLAHLKGEYDALVVNAKNKKCSYANELKTS
jgi:hypothetical protein